MSTKKNDPFKAAMRKTLQGKSIATTTQAINAAVESGDLQIVPTRDSDSGIQPNQLRKARRATSAGEPR